MVHRFALESASPDGDPSWLSPSEWPDYARLAPPTQRSWLLGRVLAKQLVRSLLAPSAEPSALSIFSRNGLGRGTQPRVFLYGRALDCSLSIAHAGGVVLVGLGTGPQFSVGVDVTAPFQPTQGFLDLFVTPRERAGVEAGSLNAARLWAVKEAAYKALNRGEPFEPRGIEVQSSAFETLRFIKSGPGAPIHGSARLLTLGPAIGALVACERQEGARP
jgi:phosphopantetheinyl transferase